MIDRVLDWLACASAVDRVFDFIDGISDGFGGWPRIGGNPPVYQVGRVLGAVVRLLVIIAVVLTLAWLVGHAFAAGARS